jgi:membrane peptidoglycan carboxypeptidase
MNGTDIGAAATVIQPGTGDVLAMAQNTTYSLTTSPGKTSVNYAVDSKYGGSGGFAFGSTAKMFAVATALQSGMPIDSIIYARPADATHPAIFTHGDYPPGDQCAVYPGTTWPVRNDEGTRVGPISLTDATAFSVNTAFAGLVASLGACKVRDMMTNLGLHRGNDGKPIGTDPKSGTNTGPSAITLGSDSVAPVTLASAYASIASGGIYCAPSPVLTITDSDKKLLPQVKGQCRKALEPTVANGVTQILKAVITRGTGAGNDLADGRPAAGKTGTTDSSKQSWFVGFTPQLATAVWVGTPYSPQSMSNLQLGNKFYGGPIFGATVAAPTWKLIMDRASAGLPILDFGNPSSQVQSGDMVQIPGVAGMSVSQAMAALTAAAFNPVVGSAVPSNLPAGQVVGTQPGAQALRGATVVILTSAGNTPSQPTPATPATITQPTPAATRTPGTRLPRCRPGGPTPCR